MSLLLGLVATAPILQAWVYEGQFDGDAPDWHLARSRIDRQKGSDWFRRIQAGNVTVKAIRRGPSYWPEIALTFDDGPHGEVTKELLDLLDEYDVRATFFVVGKMVQDRKVLTKEIFDRGHEIANHTYSHPNLSPMDIENVLTEYKATNLLVEKITGETPRYCRPPGGQMNVKVLQAASALGLSTVYWDNNPGDYKFDDPEDILVRLRINRRNGSIVLLHSGLRPTVEALRTFIPESKRMGYRFVLVGEWDSPENSDVVGSES
jgi:peptidoglycan/xylan/chitin deacetylase (PgdA/CDA1 family)